MGIFPPFTDLWKLKHLSTKWQSQDLNIISVAPKPELFTMIYPLLIGTFHLFVYYSSQSSLFLQTIYWESNSGWPYLNNWDWISFLCIALCIWKNLNCTSCHLLLHWFRFIYSFIPIFNKDLLWASCGSNALLFWPPSRFQKLLLF